MLFEPTLLRSRQTLFTYPRPLDGKARTDLQSEINRLLHLSNVDNYALIENTYDLTVSFASAADQSRFYQAFNNLSGYSADNIFSHPSTSIGRVTRIRVIETSNTLAPV